MAASSRSRGTHHGRPARLAVAALTLLGVLQLASAGPAVGAPVCNTAAIAIDIPPPPGASEVRKALLYPSVINISGLTGVITDVDVTLNGIAHPFPEDLDVLLVGPDGSTRLLVMSDIGGSNSFETDVSGINFTLSDQAANPIPINGPLVSGTFKPTDDDTDLGEFVPNHDDIFPNAPVDAGTATTLSVFNGLNPNGQWSLYVVDDDPGPPTPAPQGLLGGWCIDITTSATTTTSTTITIPTTSTTTTLPPTSTTSSTTTTLPPTSTTSSTTTTLPPTSTTSSTTTTLPPTSTTSSTTTTLPPTSTTTSSTTTTLPPTSTSTSTTVTLPPSSTSSTSSTLPPITACNAPPPPTIQAQPGVPTFGTEGNDVIYGTAGSDRIYGGGGNDIIVGLGGDDQLSGGDGNDVICGGDGNDQISGDAGNDLLVGDAGNDVLSGAGGDDRLIGGTGIDRLSGSSGTDTCTAGGSPGDFSAPPPDCDTIT